jgi:rhamnosyltransferase
MAEAIKTISPQQLLAVLVSYGQAPQLSRTWQSLQATAAGQSMHWLVYDNSAVAATNLPTNLHYEHHPENPGVSAAYLRAAAVAADLGARWLLLLDQDSDFAADWFEAYEEAVKKYPEAKLFTPLIRHEAVVVSPAPLRWGRAWAAKNAPPEQYQLSKFAPINAGMLLNLAAYQQAGGHRAAVALDFSDFAFTFFFRRSFPMAVLVPTTLEHRLSGAETASFEQRLARYTVYCRDGWAFVRAGGPRWSILAWMLWRALVLGIRYRRLAFFWVFSQASHTH